MSESYWSAQLFRLEDDGADIDERLRHAVDAARVDGWQAVGVITSVESRSLYLVVERKQSPTPAGPAGEAEWCDALR